MALPPAAAGSLQDRAGAWGILNDRGGDPDREGVTDRASPPPAGDLFRPNPQRSGTSLCFGDRAEIDLGMAARGATERYP